MFGEAEADLRSVGGDEANSSFDLSKFYTMSSTISFTNFYDICYWFSSSALFKRAEMLIIGLFSSTIWEVSVFFSSDSMGVTYNISLTWVSSSFSNGDTGF